MIDPRAILVYLRYLKRDSMLALKIAFGMGDTQSWKRFHNEVRSQGYHLLRMLGKFENSILVAGCQRSGTTILARVITQSEGMINYPVRSDDELDAALILSGVEEHEPKGRYCFQTTYLNECYPEYFNDKYDYKLIWVLRNPFSVVYSMKYNWSRFSFNELFDACGATLLNDIEKQRYERHGRKAFSRTARACLSYNGKELQALELMKSLGKNRILVVEYDDLVRNKSTILPYIYSFIQLPYKAHYADKIHNESVKKLDRLSRPERNIIEELSVPVYEKVKMIAARDGMMIPGNDSELPNTLTQWQQY